ncbi:hypothetical protein H9Q69_010265 [Fusarium xylarioides]|uniref:Methyltransferase type 11 domain-containing protein n=1 Tax=Fusarium xylarioides TaxID=221167 RepID=A0A9P7HY30_9HYPO|nr:hypothetical protein H9Q72_003395 [Fusarium xylarioides]KAG5790674.1 hypothetical protein H9Q69_010265 [Fusarium xylarioides]
MTITEDQQLGLSEYWDSHYATSNDNDPAHEWYRSFSQALQFLQKNLLEQTGRTAQDDPRILHLGSGDSTVPAELAERGYQKQLCVDFSPVVVNMMTERHKEIVGIEWSRVDVRDMPSIATGSIDVAFDKGTLDAMIYGSPWSPPDEVRENTSRYMKEVHRVLRADGVFLNITFRQPHFMKLVLNPDNIFDIEVEVLEDGGGFDYYGYVVKKSQ